MGVFIWSLNALWGCLPICPTIAQSSLGVRVNSQDFRPQWLTQCNPLMHLPLEAEGIKTSLVPQSHQAFRRNIKQGRTKYKSENYMKWWEKKMNSLKSNVLWVRASRKHAGKTDVWDEMHVGSRSEWTVCWNSESVMPKGQPKRNCKGPAHSGVNKITFLREMQKML